MEDDTASQASSRAARPAISRDQVNEFSDKVKAMCELQDQIKAMAAQRKVLSDQVNDLKEWVKDFMLAKRVATCNYEADEIFVNRREAAGGLTRKSLKGALDNYYPDEENASTDVFNFVVEQLGAREVVEVKRRKRKAEKPAKAPRAKRGAPAPAAE
jgi:type I site-specific restriction endonuclease